MIRDPQPVTANRVFTRLAWIIFLLSAIGFIYYLLAYFLIPQFNYTGLDGVAGSDYVTYYLGPLVDESLGMDRSVFVVDDFRAAIVRGHVEISHTNPAYASWALRSPEGFISTPFTLWLFRYSLSRLPFWLSLNLWVLLSIGMLIIVVWGSARQALLLSTIPLKSWRAWQLLAVASLVFLFAPCLVSIGLGQINPIVLLLMALGLFAYLFLTNPIQQNVPSEANRRLCWILGPLCLGLAINIKIVPGFLILFLCVLGTCKAINSRPSSNGRWKSFLCPEVYFGFLGLLWTLLIAIGTIGADGVQHSLDWLLLALPRAMQSSAVIAPADLPDLETYVSFLTRASVISAGIARVFKYAIAGLMAALAIDVCWMVSNTNSKNLPMQRLRVWLAISFWFLALFSWTFMRCHYLIMAVLIFPPLLAAIRKIALRSDRILASILAGLSYAGFSHPILIVLMSGGIPNYVAPGQFPINGYNLLIGYPATLILAAAVWLTIKQTGYQIRRVAWPFARFT